MESFDVFNTNGTVALQGWTESFQSLIKEEISSFDKVGLNFPRTVQFWQQSGAAGTVLSSELIELWWDLELSPLLSPFFILLLVACCFK